MGNRGTTIGEAYLQIKPSMEGIEGDIERAMGDAGSAGGKSFGTMFGKGLGAMAGISAVAVGAVAAETGAITKSAVENFANYEQLVGGIETLFGDSADAVMAHANEAFASAGMSANDYMETAIQSGAAMLNSLDGDTAKASQLMDMSITDMADNVNKMGTSMEAVQNAYRGFSRGNFTMLDNLSLGFAGTKEGMQELLDKASELSGVEYDISSYSDIVEAIHVVQTEMGITGTTAEEASGTISGSLASMSAAWQNLVTGFANPDADLGTLIDQFVQSALTALNNLMPTIINALKGIAQALPQIVQAIAEQLPIVLPEILPPLIEALIGIMQAIVESLPVILEALISALPSIINMIIDTVLTMLPMIIDLGLQLILALADGLIEALPDLIPAIVDVILTIVDKLTDPDTIVQLVNAAIQLIGAIAIGIVKAIPKIVAKVPEIIKNIVITLTGMSPEMWDSGVEAIMAFLEGLGSKALELIEKGRELFNSFKEGITEKLSAAGEWGKDLIENFIQGIKDKFNKVKETLTSLGDLIKGMIGFSEPDFGPLSNFHTYAPDMMNLFAEGITGNMDVVEGAMDEMTGTIKDDLMSPSISYSSAGAIATPRGNDLYSLLAEYLPMLASKDNAQISLVGDAEGLFRLMRNENEDYIRRTGQSAFV